MKRRAHYTNYVGEQICEHIALGCTLEEALVKVGYIAPSKSTVWKWFDAHPDFREKYERALQFQADSHADTVIQLGRKVLDSPKFAPAFKVAIDVMKWSAEVRNRGKYGSKGEATKTKPMDANKMRAEIKRLEKELGVAENKVVPLKVVGGDEK